MSRNYEVKYKNIRVLNSDWDFVSFTSGRKKYFYIKNRLADEIDERTIRLKFKPKGSSNDKFISTPRKSICVVCGTEENLTVHHIIPDQFRRHNKYLNRDRSHDNVRICKKHHEIYEKHFASKLKQDLYKQYNITNYQQYYRKILSYRRIIKKHNNLIPAEKLESLIYKSEDHVVEPCKKLRSILLVREYKNNKGLDDFIVLWRKNFVDAMKPQYLTENWSVDYHTKNMREL